MENFTSLISTIMVRYSLFSILLWHYPRDDKIDNIEPKHNLWARLISKCYGSKSNMFDHNIDNFSGYKQKLENLFFSMNLNSAFHLPKENLYFLNLRCSLIILQNINLHPLMSLWL